MNMRQLKKRNFRKIRLGFMMRDLRKLITDALAKRDGEFRHDMIINNAKHYIGGVTGLADLLGEDTSSSKSLLRSGLMDNLEPGAASAANKQSRERLDHLHQSINGPAMYAKIGSMGTPEVAGYSTQPKMEPSNAKFGASSVEVPSDLLDRTKELIERRRVEKGVHVRVIPDDE